MPPDDTLMTRLGAERSSTGASREVRAKKPIVLVAKEISCPSADTPGSLNCTFRDYHDQQSCQCQQCSDHAG